MPLSPLIVALAFGACGAAADDLPPLPDFDLIKLTAGPWLTSGMSRWQTSFPLVNGIPKSQLAFGSTLEFNDPHDLIWLYSAEVRPLPRFSLELQYGDTKKIGGYERDHDWIYGPNYVVVAPSGNTYVSPQYTDMSLSRADQSGRATYVEGNAYVRVLVYDGRKSGESVLSYQWIDVGAGYFLYDDRFRMKNLLQIISTGDFIQTPAPGAYPGLDSTFHFHYEGAKLALREATGLYERLRAIATFGYSPLVSYHGDGYWNGRSQFRSQAPNFVQWAHGSLVEGRLTLAWDPVPFVTAEAGYMLVYAWTRPGTILAYLANGSTASQDLDSAWSERKGWMASLAVKF